jgi:HEAT repeat protein
MNIVNAEVKVLLEQLTAPHWQVRKKAVERFMELGAEARDAAPLLIKALDDRSWKVREASARSLGRIGSRMSPDDELGDEIIVYLINAMVGDSTWNVSITAINALAEIGSRSMSAVPALIVFLQEEDEDVRISCIEALRQIQTANSEAIHALIEVLADPVERVRRRAANALVELGVSDHEHLPALIKALEDPDVHVRRHIYKLLGRLASAPNVIPLLMDAMKDTNGFEESFVIDGLVEAESAAVPTLVEALQNPDNRMRITAGRALSYLGPHAGEAVPALIRSLADPEYHVRYWASDSLKKIGTIAVSALLEALNTRDENLQEEIISTLGKMSLKIVPILLQSFEEGGPNLRMNIAKALHKLGPEGIIEIIRLKSESI